MEADPPSKNALKTELKKKQKEDEKLLKEEEKKKEVAATQNSQSHNDCAVEDGDMDATQYYDTRRNYIASLKITGINPYPHKFGVSIRAKEYIQKYTSLNQGEHLKDVEVNLAGRIMNKRTSSSKLYFYDLYDDGVNVQVMADVRDSDLDEVDFSRVHGGVKCGDIVGICGYPGKRKSGDLSVFPKTFVVLSHSLHMMPRQEAAPGVDNPSSKETRYRQRYLDLILNQEVREIFETRAYIISYIRRFLDNLNFLEVETPMMKGLIRNPFLGPHLDMDFYLRDSYMRNPFDFLVSPMPLITHHNDLNMDFYLRESSKAFLMKFIVRGFDRVYEIGKQFKKAGFSPEVTTCEVHMADTDCTALMVLTEQMVSGMVKELTGGYKINFHANGLDREPIEIDFTPPFRRIDMIEELERMTNLDLPKDLFSEDSNKYLVDACARFNVACPPPQTNSSLLRKLFDHLLGELCGNPSFIMNDLAILSSGLLWYNPRTFFKERFHLFINKHALCNAYTINHELIEHREHFAGLMKNCISVNDEKIILDEYFRTIPKFGSTPTSGWELGIDRLAMILTDSQNIEEVLLFPIMKPQDEPSSKGKSKRGELSVFPKACSVLSHSLHMMPRKKAAHGVDNPSTMEIRHRQFYGKLRLHLDVILIFKTRAWIILYIRRILEDLNFLEVETPNMNMIASRTAVKPFVTHQNELNIKLYMRISPELYLKQLVVGGLDRVYEIGKQFRNEGIGFTHNPEFTTCDFYMAYADYNDLMVLTEQMISGMVKELTGGYKINFHANGLDREPIEIDFTPPFRRIDMIEELERITNLDIPKDLFSEDANKYLVDACARFNVACPTQTTSSLLHKLVGHFLEEVCVNPSFIINHPEIMSPSAKRHRSRPGLTERFELFINKHALCNACTTLNDPIVQRERFAEQLKNLQSGDDEAMTLDESFCTAFEYGLPPTGGCELIIDRLTMILADSQNIKEVIVVSGMEP